MRRVLPGHARKEVYYAQSALFPCTGSNYAQSALLPCTPLGMHPPCTPGYTLSYTPWVHPSSCWSLYYTPGVLHEVS